MKKVILVTSFLFFLAILGASEPDTILDQDLLTKDQTYRHACEFVAATNRKDWNSLPGHILDLLKAYAEPEDWKGIGAYKRTSTKSDNLDPWDLKHHFSYESIFGPQELLIIYRKEGDGYIFDRIMVLGW